MLQLEAIEILGRVLPEAFISVLAIHVFARAPLDKKLYAQTGLLLTAIIYLVRLLPISYGIHTIIIMSVLILQAIAIHKIAIKHAIQGTIITVLLQLVAEGLNVVLVEKVFGQDMQVILQNPIDKIIYGIPSLLILFILIMTYHFIRKKVGKNAA